MTITDKSNHIISKALILKGYKDFEIIFAPKWSPDYGWTVVKGYGLPLWLGYDKKMALREIGKL
jgi:hypothetical protein